eukprot:GHVL01012568.1.p1 GENE.GHVL01012568.1~~GHVL01012568.1.p1  ORF type:complete len:183 (-),score=12.58 GHVL01012568.1:365-913(-)
MLPAHTSELLQNESTWFIQSLLIFIDTSLKYLVSAATFSLLLIKVEYGLLRSSLSWSFLASMRVFLNLSALFFTVLSIVTNRQIVNVMTRAFQIGWAACMTYWWIEIWTGLGRWLDDGSTNLSEIQYRVCIPFVISCALTARRMWMGSSSSETGSRIRVQPASFFILMWLTRIEMSSSSTSW